ncbi:MAG TPA: penicillin-binding protein activator LpoB [Fibrobacteria bacterium]|nr:penicillin-binding protein activator LpoB [Fibrobacteria bacterium]
MSRFTSRLLKSALAAVLLTGCSTKVTRVTHDSTIDLTGKWNDTDSRLVAEEMVKDATNGAWYAKYAASKTTPTVVVGEIRNKSHEHISTGTFINDIQRALINSGKVEFVANKAERGQIRDEKTDQADNASVETRQSAGEESGAKLMMIGELNSIVDQEGGKAVVFYQVNLELVEIESHKKLWIGDKKIKKYVERSETRF